MKKSKVIKLQVPETAILMFTGNAKELDDWLSELQSSDEISKDLKNKIRKNIIEDGKYVKSFDKCNGRFVKIAARGGLFFVNGKFKKDRKQAIAVHEIIHVVDYVSDIFKIEDREYRSYLGEFLYQEFCQMLKSKRGSNK
jgi:hypothetical protein